MKTINLIEQKVKTYVEHKRPVLELRNQLDLGYLYSDNIVEIFQIRPQWNDNTIFNNFPIAKAKYIKSKNYWTIFWIGKSGKWTTYKPTTHVTTIDDFFEVIDKDSYACFWG